MKIHYILIIEDKYPTNNSLGLTLLNRFMVSQQGYSIKEYINNIGILITIRMCHMSIDY